MVLLLSITRTGSVCGILSDLSRNQKIVQRKKLQEDFYLLFHDSNLPKVTTHISDFNYLLASNCHLLVKQTVIRTASNGIIPLKSLFHLQSLHLILQQRPDKWTAVCASVHPSIKIHTQMRFKWPHSQVFAKSNQHHCLLLFVLYWCSLIKYPNHSQIQMRQK